MHNVRLRAGEVVHMTESTVFSVCTDLRKRARENKSFVFGTETQGRPGAGPAAVRWAAFGCICN